jgi:serine/threonine protein phosphatase PrpC
MDHPLQLTIFGRDHQVRGEIYCRELAPAKAALGTSPGVTAKPNEDAAGVSVHGKEMVLAIADGHWGREASEIAVTKAMELQGPEIRPSRESETRARLFSLFEQVNITLYEMALAAPGASTPETTLMVCHIKEDASQKYLYWSSFGDSYLFLLREGQWEQLNTLQPRWLGYLSRLSEKAETRSILMRFLADEARYVGVASGLETGIEKLNPGDTLFLCTDGLLGSDKDPDPAVLEGIKGLLGADIPPGDRVEKMISSALARGERDNISCVVALIE